jgi:hypothetical protein
MIVLSIISVSRTIVLSANFKCPLSVTVNRSWAAPHARIFEGWETKVCTTNKFCRICSWRPVLPASRRPE